MKTNALAEMFDADEVDKVLREGFFQPAAAPSSRRAERKGDVGKDNKSYEIVCISLYKDDLEQLDTQVQELRAAGFHRINRSALVRAALRQLSPAKLRKLLAAQL